MAENQIAKHILDAAFVVHTKLGPGVYESVYEVRVAYELGKRGLNVERQKPMPITHAGVRFDEAFRSDLIVNGKVVAELKSVEKLSPVPRETSSYSIALERIETRFAHKLRRRASKKWD